MAIPPGSVFKALSAIALLESHVIDPDAPFGCQGFLRHPNHFRCYIYRHHGVGHGDTRLVDALTRSCNVYFYQAAERLGPKPFVHWARQFGFGRPTGIDLPGERGGNLPDPDPAHGQRRLPWYRGDTLGLAIGQARLTVTPLQIARMMAAIANGGELVTPHVVTTGGAARITGPEVDSADARTRMQTTGALRENLARVREGLSRVVSHPRGTGYKSVRMSQISIAGKTGTAEVQGHGDHAWFAGYVPADRPRIAFAVVLQHAGTGGKVAGPVARQFVEGLLALGVLKPERRLAAQP
jgi:penicillin-binding protein 2